MFKMPLPSSLFAAHIFSKSCHCLCARSLTATSKTMASFRLIRNTTDNLTTVSLCTISVFVRLIVIVVVIVLWPQSVLKNHSSLLSGGVHKLCVQVHEPTICQCSECAKFTTQTSNLPFVFKNMECVNCHHPVHTFTENLWILKYITIIKFP
jgi:hypothetical protein